MFGEIHLNFFENKIKLVFGKNLKKFAINLHANLSLLTQVTVQLQKAFISSAVGFKSYLRVRGVGYKLTYEKNYLTITAGLSYELKTIIHPEILIKGTRKFKMLRLKSKNLTTLTNTISFLRNLRKPDVYKGKGIRYRREIIRRKQGKKLKRF